MRANTRACNEFFHAAQETLPRDDIRRELDRIAGSAIFRASLRLTSFLTFVVEAALAGHSDTIKAYTIAVEALGRSPSFDPQADPIVRVEAGRLRHALARYYAEAGRDDPLTIDVPRGTYVPAFHRRRTETTAPSAAPRPRMDHADEIARRRHNLRHSLTAIRDLVEVHRRQIAILTVQIETAAAEVETLACAAVADHQAKTADVANANAIAGLGRDLRACETPRNSASRHCPCRRL
jgi:hypothetical protein